jgi:malate dehydrogenase (oxaloacetate-decarboxylating)
VNPNSATWNAECKRWETTARGHAALTDPRLNRGTAFTDEERRALNLVGLLPPRTLDLNDQAIRA